MEVIASSPQWEWGLHDQVNWWRFQQQIIDIVESFLRLLLGSVAISVWLSAVCYLFPNLFKLYLILTRIIAEYCKILLIFGSEAQLEPFFKKKCSMYFF